VTRGLGPSGRRVLVIDDVVQANRRAVTTDTTRNASNIGSGEPISIAELADLMREVTGSDPPITRTEVRPGDITASPADISAARAVSGYSPTIDLDTGLESVVRRED